MLTDGFGSRSSPDLELCFFFMYYVVIVYSNLYIHVFSRHGHQSDPESRVIRLSKFRPVLSFSPPWIPPNTTTTPASAIMLQ